MKPNPKAPSERDLSLLTGASLLLLSVTILLICYIRGGPSRGIPALPGWGLIVCGALIVLTTLRRRRRTGRR